MFAVIIILVHFQIIGKVLQTKAIPKSELLLLKGSS